MWISDWLLGNSLTFISSSMSVQFSQYCQIKCPLHPLAVFSSTGAYGWEQTPELANRSIDTDPFDILQSLLMCACRSTIYSL